MHWILSGHQLHCFEAFAWLSRKSWTCAVVCVAERSWVWSAANIRSVIFLQLGNKFKKLSRCFQCSVVQWLPQPNLQLGRSPQSSMAESDQQVKLLENWHPFNKHLNSMSKIFWRKPSVDNLLRPEKAHLIRFSARSWTRWRPPWTLQLISSMTRKDGRWFFICDIYLWYLNSIFFIFDT